jgi:hypothetical protein
MNLFLHFLKYSFQVYNSKTTIDFPLMKMREQVFLGPYHYRFAWDFEDNNPWNTSYNIFRFS